MAGYQIAQLPGLKLISGRTSDVKKPDIRSSQGNDYSEDYQKKESYPINNSFHEFFFYKKQGTYQQSTYIKLTYFNFSLSISFSILSVLFWLSRVRAETLCELQTLTVSLIWTFWSIQTKAPLILNAKEVLYMSNSECTKQILQDLLDSKPESVER